MPSGYLRLGICRRRDGDHEGALGYYRKALELRRELVERNPDTNRYDRDLAVATNYVGSACLKLGLDEAGEHLRAYADITDRLALLSPDDQRAQRDWLNGRQRYGDFCRAQERLDEALAEYERYNERAIELRKRFPDDTQIERQLATSHQRLAVTMLALGRTDEGMEHYRTAERLYSALVEANPEDARYRSDLEFVRTAIAELES